jgi:carboxylate-amine ligase
MSDMDFSQSQSLSFGVELELQCLNTREYDLTTTAQELLRLLQDLPCPGEIKPEITQSMIEVNSAVYLRHDALLANLIAIRDVMVEKAQLLNVRIAGGGTHAFQMWSDRRIFEGERYEMLSNKYGYLAKQFTVFGQHIHIGCTSGDEAIWLLHRMSYYVPAFIALSAASPFYQNQDTLFSSSRLTSINAFPLSGTIPFVQTWQAFSEYYYRMKDLGIISSMKDFYWDIRPKPEYGTIELRICDTPLTVQKAAALAALAQTLALSMLENGRRPIDEGIYLAYRYNRFNAARYGLSGEFIDAVTGRKQELGEMICQTIDGLWDFARELGTTSALQLLYQSALNRRNDADRLRAIYLETRSFSDVTRRSAEIWEDGSLEEPRPGGR